MIADVRGLRPALPILIGTAVMLSLSLGIRQSFGLFQQPITKDLALSVSDFTIAVSIRNLTWGFLQPIAGALVVRHGLFEAMFGRTCSLCRSAILVAVP